MPYGPAYFQGDFSADAQLSRAKVTPGCKYVPEKIKAGAIYDALQKPGAMPFHMRANAPGGVKFGYDEVG